MQIFVCQNVIKLIKQKLTNEQIGIFDGHKCDNRIQPYACVGLYSDWIERNTDNLWNNDRSNSWYYY